MKISYSNYRFLTSLIYLLIRPAVSLLEIVGLKSLVHFLSRFASYDFKMVPKSGMRIWIHASSVGETGAACAIIREIEKKRPGVSIMLSTVTATGMQTASRLTGSNVLKIIAPLDFEQVINKALHFFSPDVLVLTETELWPNMIMSAKRSGARVIIANGRISESSAKAYVKLNPISAEIMDEIYFFSMISKIDADRIIKLGGNPDRVLVNGNSKYDQSIMLRNSLKEIEIAEKIEKLIRLRGRRLIVAGSTRPGEEEIIVDSFYAVKDSLPESMLIIAPRHPERTEAVERVLKKRAIPYMLRTSLNESTVSTHDIIILNTIGELSAIYRLADAVICGGSLLPFGGQNPIEAAVIGKPVIFGKHMNDFRDVADLLISSGAAIEIEDEVELPGAIHKIMTDHSAALEIGNRAAYCIDKMSGAAKRHAAVICEALCCK